MSDSPRIAYTVPKSVSLGDFKRFSATSIEKLASRGLTIDDAKELWLSKSRWVCTRCGERQDPEGLREVFEISGGTKPTIPSAKSILKGICAKEGCDSGFVWVKLEASPDVEWPEFFGEGGEEEQEAGQNDEIASFSEGPGEIEEPARASGWGWWGPRVVVGIAVVVLLFTIVRESGLGSRVRAIGVDPEDRK